MTTQQISHNLPRSIFDWLFRDKHGRIAVAQKPNFLIIAWAVSRAVVFFTRHTHSHAKWSLLSSALLFSWSYLEITSGSSNFRRLLGGIIMFGIVRSFFR